jgi:hypothetical protein
LEQHIPHKAEVQKIAHVLDVPTEEVIFLSSHSEKQLEFLFHAISMSIQKDQSQVWEPLAKVVKFIPNFLNAKISEEVLGPHITANITYHVGVKDAISISNFFSNKFFADVMEHVLPEKIEHILKEAPIEKMRIVLQELLKRKNYYQLSSLMDYVPIDRAAKLTLEVEDYEILSTVAYLSSKKDRHWKILATYTDDRIKGFLQISLEQDRAEMIQEIYNSADSNFKSRLKNLMSGFSENLLSQVKL